MHSRDRVWVETLPSHRSLGAVTRRTLDDAPLATRSSPATQGRIRLAFWTRSA